MSFSPASYLFFPRILVCCYKLEVTFRLTVLQIKFVVLKECILAPSCITDAEQSLQIQTLLSVSDTLKNFHAADILSFSLALLQADVSDVSRRTVSHNPHAIRHLF